MFWRKSYKRKVAFEDALKHIYDCESRKMGATLFSLSGILKFKSKKTTALVEEMENRGLVKVAGNALHLTPRGRAWALQVIRAHRLWESYLSDEAGLPLEKIHKEAEKKEHSITPTQADEIEAQLGYPPRDPHGDPIPSSTYAIEKVKGVPLTDWPIGKVGRIVHIEDEPQEVYTQILAEGLLPYTDIKVAESGERGFHLWHGMEECWLPPVVVDNIYVEEFIEKKEEIRGEPLADLKPGERGRIVAVRSQGSARRRFMDLGLLPGAVIEVVMSSALAEPIAYKVRETMIALRREQTEQIFIEPLTKHG